LLPVCVVCVADWASLFGEAGIVLCPYREEVKADDRRKTRVRRSDVPHEPEEALIFTGYIKARGIRYREAKLETITSNNISYAGVAKAIST
jgi:hypothetical protein